MKYRREIDGLRALAVLPVILFHAGFTTFSGGFVGVDIFFVISGYLITTIIVDEIDKGTFSILKFYERRARRILPALFFVMFCTLPFAWAWMLPQDLKGFSESLFAVPLFASNILFFLTSGYFDTASELKPLLHTWSLAVEEQYYVLFPIFLMLTWKFGKAWILSALAAIAVASLAAAQWTSVPHPSFAFYLLPTRAFEILIGALVALYLSRKANPISSSLSIGQPASLAGLALIVCAIFTFDSKTPSPSLYTLVPTVGAGLILAFASSANMAGKILGSRAFVAIGLISYSAYLWHQPLFAFAKLRTFDELSNSTLSILSAASLGLAYLSWKYIEAPFREKNRIRTASVAYFGLASTAVFLALGAIGYINKGFETRVSSRIDRLLKNPQEPITNEACLKLYPQFSKFSACLLSKNQSPDVVIIGDSHSQHYFKSLANALPNKSVMNIGAWSCLPFSSQKHSSINDCLEKIDLALKFVSGTSSIKTVIVSGYWSYLSSGGFSVVNRNYRAPDAVTKIQSESFLVLGHEVLSELVGSGKKIIVMKDTPDLDFNIQSCFDMKPYKINDVKLDCSINYTAYKNRHKAHDALLASLLDKYRTIELYSPRELFCSEERNSCTAKVDNEPLYFNSDHLTLAGSDMVIKDLLNKHKID